MSLRAAQARTPLSCQADHQVAVHGTSRKAWGQHQGKLLSESESNAAAIKWRVLRRQMDTAVCGWQGVSTLKGTVAAGVAHAGEVAAGRDLEELLSRECLDEEHVCVQNEVVWRGDYLGTGQLYLHWHQRFKHNLGPFCLWSFTVQGAQVACFYATAGMCYS